MWTDFLIAIPIGTLADTGIETVSNMSEEARDEATTIPKPISRVRLAVSLAAPAVLSVRRSGALASRVAALER